MTEPSTVTTMLPTSLKAQEALQEQTSKLAPTALFEYWRDFAQRSILFLDILRRRGNQYEEMRAHTINSVSDL